MREEILRSLNSQIELKDFKLNSLLDITTAINSNKDVRELTRLFEFIVKEQLGYDKFVLFNKQEEWNCLLRVGFRGKVKNIDVVAELGRFQEITFIESSQSKLLNDFDVIIPVFHNDVALAYLLIEATESDGNNNKVLNYMSFIQTLANIIVVAIENKRMTKVGIRQESLKKELEVASAMQQLLFPSDLPTNTRMDISAMYKPRHEVGGDYYDFIFLNENVMQFMFYVCFHCCYFR